MTSSNRRAPAPPPRSSLIFPWSALFLIVLALLELDWFVRFESMKLSNAGGIPRWLFLARALPQIVPGVTFPQSYLGLGLVELSHFENLPQRLPIVATSALIAAAALGLGSLILRALRLNTAITPAERIALAFGLGASALGVITLLAGRLALLTPWTAHIGLALPALIEAYLFFRELKNRPARLAPHVPRSRLPSRLGFASLAGPFLVLMALGSMLPSIDFDAIEYHLQGPKEYYQAGRISFLPHNVYTSMPFSVEMLHLLGMEVLDDWWWGALAGQLLVALHAPMAALLIMRTASRFVSPRAAWFAGIVYLTTPWIYRLGVLPYVEGPLAYYHAALVWAAARAWTEPSHLARPRFWTLTGLLAGGAMACKYPALLSAVLPFGFVALLDSLRRRSPSAVFAFSIASALVISPWLLKNVIDTGNPVYPLAYKIFGGSQWSPAMDQKWSSAHGPKRITAVYFKRSLDEIAGASDWQSPLYLAFAPLALLRPSSRRFSAAILAYVAYLFLTWWFLTHRLDRFWLPMLPALALLAGIGADWSLSRFWSITRALILALAFVANLSYASTALTGLNMWTDDLYTLRASVPEMLNPPLSKTNALCPPGSKILLVGQAAVFHLNHPIVYNTVFDDETFETLARDKSPQEIRDSLKSLGVTHIYVDWFDIERYRSPGNYGFTPFVQPSEFNHLVQAGILDAPDQVGKRQELYRVR